MSSTESSREPEAVRQPEHVRALLQRLISGRCMAHIWHPSGTEAHLSTLLGLKPNQGVYLDAPMDSVIDLYRKGDALEIHSRLDGTAVRFKTRLQLFSRYEGYPALLCAWPEEVHHYERRTSFRVHVTGSTMKAELALDNETRIHEARLVDLSVGGFGALVDTEARLEAGEVLDCQLDLRGSKLALKASVQGFNEAPGTRFCRLGARFVEVDPAQERRLSKLVLELERQAIQHSRGH